MCSIAACANRDQRAAQEVAESLSCMTYRGYDSAGISVWDGECSRTEKVMGTNFDDVRLPTGGGAIGQTRWATRGKNDLTNANPQVSGDDTAAVMNGTVSNYEELRIRLEAYGYRFVSDNDTEAIVHVAHMVRGDMKRLAEIVQGRYSCIVMYHGRIGCIRRGPSLAVGKSVNGMYVASDIMAFATRADMACHMKEDTFMYVDLEGCRMYRITDGGRIDFSYERVARELAEPQASGAITNTEAELQAAAGLLDRAPQHIEASSKTAWAVTGSGSSYHTALLAEHLMRQSGVQVMAFPACEYQSYDIGDSTLLAISQSGETGDVLRAVEAYRGNDIVAITNGMQSSLATLADTVVDIECGPEYGVAATKSFMAQARIVMEIAGVPYERGTLPDAASIPDGIIERLCKASDIYVLGSGIHHIAALEGALKLKELLYVHAEAAYAGEFKHGPLAALTAGTVAVVLDPDGQQRDTVNEIRARGGHTLVISDNTPYDCDYTLKMDTSGQPHEVFIREVWALQMLAIRAATAANHDVDRPRHLAKCVTV